MNPLVEWMANNVILTGIIVVTLVSVFFKGLLSGNLPRGILGILILAVFGYSLFSNMNAGRKIEGRYDKNETEYLQCINKAVCAASSPSCRLCTQEATLERTFCIKNYIAEHHSPPSRTMDDQVLEGLINCDEKHRGSTLHNAVGIVIDIVSGAFTWVVDKIGEALDK